MPRREEVMGGWRRLCEEEFHNLYALQNIVRVQFKEDEMDSLCSMHGRDEKFVKKKKL